VATPLSYEEAVAAVNRVLRGVFRSHEEDPWLALAERSLGLSPGSLSGRIAYPAEHGLSDDPTAEEIVADAQKDKDR
jgi:hypothetical protein